MKRKGMKLNGLESNTVQAMQYSRMDGQRRRGGEDALVVNTPRKKLNAIKGLEQKTMQAMQCNAMQCNAMQCNAMQCNAMQCNAMQCNAMQCNAMQCNAM
jgi:hypothetical protein